MVEVEFKVEAKDLRPTSTIQIRIKVEDEVKDLGSRTNSSSR